MLPATSQPQHDLTCPSLVLFAPRMENEKHKKRAVYLFISFKSCMRAFPRSLAVVLWILSARVARGCCCGNAVPHTNRISIFCRVIYFGFSALDF